ncbi:dienelactone hydrolase family protein [Thiomonas sp.]|uniref:dienelactone hydrolase family protein n=1 Tax=Thiomonas sp. TaxID=2047785 RepID=UPI002625C336|nr:dienelactone hydrolase family protein [Thiomonas sp.]
MTIQEMAVDDPLDDFTRRDVELESEARAVYVAGSGPAVIVMPEMPGISPHVARFARWIRDAGFTVYLPSLFGRDGAVAGAREGAEVFQRACISREFRVLAGQGASPVTRWLRALARLAHAECAGPGVGAVGMCFTGNFALSMMLEPSVVAPVLCQPSLPLNSQASLESDAGELQTVRERLEREDRIVLAYRFEGDRFCTSARFEAYARALGDRFVAREIPDGAANGDVPPFFARYVDCPHSVVTVHLIDEVGQPTTAARDEILRFLTATLVQPGMSPQAR